MKIPEEFLTRAGAHSPGGRSRYYRARLHRASALPEPLHVPHCRASRHSLHAGYLVLSQSKLHAGGNTMTVNNLTDPAGIRQPVLHTLQQAINNANAASDTSGGDCAAGTGTDTINFSVSGKITLTSTHPAIANSSPGSLTIDGTGLTITIVGDDSFQVLQVNSGATLSLNSLTIANGYQCAGDGGAIYERKRYVTDDHELHINARQR